MPVLTDFEQLVSVGKNRTVKLSPGSLAVLFSALDLIGQLHQWRGGSSKLSTAEVDAIDSYVSTAAHELMVGVHVKEIGEPFALFVPEPPEGALALDGSAVLWNQYPLLAEKVPGHWIVGPFIELPDMRTRGLFGVGSGTNGFEVYAGETFGSDFHTLTVNEIPSHDHQQRYGATSGMIQDNGFTGGQSAGTTPAGTPYTPLTTASAGGGQPHPNMPPGVGVYWFIQAE